MIMWMTGLSGSGKTTYANYLKEYWNYIILDGDTLRSGLSKDLGFTYADREEHGRRIIEVVKILASQDFDVCVSTITGDNTGRKWVREELKGFPFKLVWVKASIETCAARDPKGIYAANPENLVGVSAKWEDPDQYDYVIDTERFSESECMQYFFSYLDSR